MLEHRAYDKLHFIDNKEDFIFYGIGACTVDNAVLRNYQKHPHYSVAMVISEGVQLIRFNSTQRYA